MNGRRSVIDELNCCFSDTYKNQTVFTFIPGHRAAILGIPNQIDRMKAEKQQKKQTKKRKTRSLEELKKMLIAQLNNFPSKAGFNLPNDVISELNIVDVVQEKQDDGSFIVNCGFSCPFCNKTTKVTFKKYWWASNATCR